MNICFARREWQVKSGFHGPQRNVWLETGIEVDGHLALSVNKIDGGVVDRNNVEHSYGSAEVQTIDALHFGTYGFDVLTTLSGLDSHVTLGLFSYGGPDGLNEIDIEVGLPEIDGKVGLRDSGFGHPHYVVYPPTPARIPSSVCANEAHAALGDAGYYCENACNPGSITPRNKAAMHARTLHTYQWSSTQIVFLSRRCPPYILGQAPLADSWPIIGSWIYAPNDPATYIPQDPMPVHINLYLNKKGASAGYCPDQRRPAPTVIISSFWFEPSC